MKYKTLFNTLCKLLGVYFVLVGCTGILQSLCYVTVYWFQMSQMGGAVWSIMWSSTASGIAHILETAAGLFIFCKSRTIADLAIPGNRPYCPEWGYDLTGNVSGNCPECGLNPKTGKQE